MSRYGLYLWFLAALGGPAASQAQLAPNLLPIPAEEQALLDQAGAEGEDLYVHDRAAEIATDTLQADHKRFRSLGRKLGGWVTQETTGGHIQVSFLNKPGRGERVVLARVIVDAEARGTAQWLDRPAPTSAYERAAANAVDAATKAEFERCARRYNSVVLPADVGTEPKGWVVWLLPATTDANILPFGGAQRFELDGSGAEVLRQRNFTKTCIQLRRPKEGQELALMISHLLDPVPTALHVYTGLKSHLPFYVQTKDRLWVLQGKQVQLVDPSEED